MSGDATRCGEGSAMIAFEGGRRGYGWLSNARSHERGNDRPALPRPWSAAMEEEVAAGVQLPFLADDLFVDFSRGTRNSDAPIKHGKSITSLRRGPLMPLATGATIPTDATAIHITTLGEPACRRGVSP